MKSRVATLTAIALLSLGATAWSERTNAQSFNQFIAFGDSSIDSGWWKVVIGSGGTIGNSSKTARIANAIANGTSGQPVGAGNLMNSQILAALFGQTAIPANQPGGTNYAISGALDAATAANGNVGNLNNSTVENSTFVNTGLPSTVQQITNYLNANGGKANPNAVYLISSGGNDTTFANDNPAFTTAAQRQAYVTAQANLLAAEITTLHAAGAQYIVVKGVAGTGFNGIATQALWSQLAANGVNFVPSNTSAIVNAAQYNPTLFGFTAATVSPGIVGSGTGSACVTQIGASATTSGWGQWCANTTAPSSSYAYLRSANSEQTSLYADDEHFSAAGQLIQADYNYSLIVAPSEISYLAEAPLKTRATIVDSIHNQIAISQLERASGTFRGWVTGDVSSLKMTSSYNGFPDDTGTPAMLTAGGDYSFANGWLAGFALSLDTTRQSFSLGGNYKMNEFAASLYGAYTGEHIWASLVGSYGTMHFDTNRIVPIGITTISNAGSTNGTNTSLAGEIGYNFRTPIGTAPTSSMPLKAASAPTAFLTHGPLIGLIWQYVNVKAFTETDPFTDDASGGFTALSFGDQTRNSSVSEVGYQASLDYGRWRPFARVVWDHELANTNRFVTASLTTIVAPSYSLPAVVLGKDWATASLGTTFAIDRGITAYATVTTQAAQSNVTTYGGQIGINVAFDALTRTAKAN